jgi:hypothetical protein
MNNNPFISRISNVYNIFVCSTYSMKLAQVKTTGEKK